MQLVVDTRLAHVPRPIARSVLVPRSYRRTTYPATGVPESMVAAGQVNDTVRPLTVGLGDEPGPTAVLLLNPHPPAGACQAASEGAKDVSSPATSTVTRMWRRDIDPPDDVGY